MVFGSATNCIRCRAAYNSCVHGGLCPSCEIIERECPHESRKNFSSFSECTDCGKVFYEKPGECIHDFAFEVRVDCLEDRKPLAQVEISGHCKKCKAAVEFIGMECGLNMSGPAVSPDQREARLAAIITTEPAKLSVAGGVKYRLP